MFSNGFDKFQAGSRETEASYHAENFYEVLQKSGMDVIIDDRTKLTIGKRILEARRTGYPYIVVIGKKSTESSPVFEILDLNKAMQLEFGFEGIVDYLITENRERKEEEISKKICYTAI